MTRPQEWSYPKPVGLHILTHSGGRTCSYHSYCRDSVLLWSYHAFLHPSSPSSPCGMSLFTLCHCILEVIFFLILLRVTTKIALILLETLNLRLRTMLALLRILDPLEIDKKHLYYEMAMSLWARGRVMV